MKEYFPKLFFQLCIPGSSCYHACVDHQVTGRLYYVLILPENLFQAAFYLITDIGFTHFAGNRDPDPAVG